MIKKIILLILFGFNLSFGFSQNIEDSTLLDKPIKVNKYKDFIRYMNLKYYYPMQIGSSFNITKISDFYLGNVVFAYRGGWFPVFVDMRMISPLYSFTFSKIHEHDIDYYNLSKRNPIQMKSLDVMLSYCPLPKFHWLSDFIVPYLGFGYCFANLQTHHIEDIFASEYSYYRLNLSSWKYKIGINFFIENSPLYLYLEYEQNFNKNKIRNFKTFNFGMYVALDLAKSKKRTNILKYVE